MENMERFPGIDGLRGLLVSIVWFFHLYSMPNSSPVSWVWQYLQHGHYAVQVFFVISGFLVSLSLDRMEKTHVIRKFYRARFARIYPMYFVSVIFWFLLYDHLPWKSFLAQITFTFGFFSYDHLYLPNFNAWSLFVEEIFYLIVPLIFFKLDFLKAILLTLVFMLVEFIWISQAADWGVPRENYFIENFFLAHLLYLFAGVGFYLGWKKYHPGPWILLSFGCVVFFIFRFKSALVLVAALSFLVLALKLPSLFNHRFLTWAGIRCYALYLLQQPVLMLGQVIGAMDPVWFEFRWIWCSLILVILSALSWKYLEVPLRTWLRQSSRPGSDSSSDPGPFPPP